MTQIPPLQPTPVGATRFNTDSSKLEYYNGNEWVHITSTSPDVQTGGTRGLFGGGYTSPALSDVIDYVNVDTTGNAVDFGNLTAAGRGVGALSSRVRGVFAGAYQPGYKNVIEYVTIASIGNAADFGDLTQGAYHPTTFSSATRGIVTGMESSPAANNNVIDYMTIASTGNAIDFGDTYILIRNGGGCSSPTRGLIFAGYSHPANTNTIQYVTISTTGTSADFGDITASATTASTGASNAVRGLCQLGYDMNIPSPSETKQIDYTTIATLGNSLEFGDLAGSDRRSCGSAASPTRGVFAGGMNPAIKDEIDHVHIMTTGNGIDFGNLSVGRAQLGGCSNGHGGLG